MSLFGDYIRERENKEIVENEHGFATYFYIPTGVYIQDIYIDKDHRHSGLASMFADSIAAKAKERGVSKMYGSVMPTANGSTESLKVLLAYGFRLESATNNAIIMVKEI